MTFITYDLDKIVSKNHKLRKINTLINFKGLASMFKDLEKTRGRDGYSLEVGLKTIFLQFLYDLSDRGVEEALQDNNAFKWFVGFSIEAKTPDHTYFGRIRKAMGAERLAELFQEINKKAKNLGFLKELFVFVDASKIITKNTTWHERDKAIKEGEEKLNNENIEKYSKDKEARFGCNGKNKFWFGYKRHKSVDMSSGLISNIFATPANVLDQQGLKYICPNDAIIFGDKKLLFRRSSRNFKKE